MANKGYQGSAQCFAQGGPVLGKTSQFMKTPDQFRTDKSNVSDENFGKGSKGGGDGGPAAPPAKGKSLSPVKPRK